MEKQQENGLIYGLNDKPPFKEAFFAALQHLLAIFVAIITPPLIIAGALKLDTETTGYLVSMALFASGISTFIQCRRFGGLGTGLLCIQGTSFSFIGPIISAGMLGGLPLIFGSCMAASSCFRCSMPALPGSLSWKRRAGSTTAILLAAQPVVANTSMRHRAICLLYTSDAADE